MDEKSGGTRAVTAGGFCAGGCCEIAKEAWWLMTERCKGQTSDGVSRDSML